ncbi:AraC family transcriptional regulator [Paracoccus sp. (in: a-proteobacteria)]
MIAAHEPLLQVAMACDFDSQSHFTRSFRAAMGIAPGQWRAAALA